MNKIILFKELIAQSQNEKRGLTIYLNGPTVVGGGRPLVTVKFNVAANAASCLTPLTFGELPVFREVVNANADVLCAEFTNGAINILAPTAAAVTIAGRRRTARDAR